MELQRDDAHDALVALCGGRRKIKGARSVEQHAVQFQLWVYLAENAAQDDRLLTYEIVIELWAADLKFGHDTTTTPK